MKTIAILILLLIASSSFAQTLRLGIGPNLALPKNSLSEIVNNGFGGTAQAEIGLAGYNLTGSVSYISFGIKKIGINGAGTLEHTIAAIPVLAGTKYDFLLGLYVSAAIGVNFMSTKVETSMHGVNKSTTLKEQNFTFAVGAGYQIAMLDLSLKYQKLAKSADIIGVNVLYNFGL